jgi:hypothetical protein
MNGDMPLGLASEILTHVSSANGTFRDCHSGVTMSVDERKAEVPFKRCHFRL